MLKEQILIAITGHRDMLKRKGLKEEVSEYFDELIVKHKDKEIVLLSPLAEGADMFVVKVFLEKKKKHKNLRLLIPLPFKKEHYVKAFSRIRKKEFLKLSREADGIFQIPSMGDPPYVELGKYLVNISDILLALWDGTFNGREGGTGDVVSYGQNMGIELKHVVCERRFG
ncbi:MAG: Unknown protein [uncultured Sulfurovum sp.]|uniref:Uncharacterized protein n=1 Tax=uncultured Sulfurovum sp. TaxID=269237 RepID=A0A6S6SYE9_9BACT|nr:MAG: Unknown protein [uncultured Sulfurovum sp.]